MPKRVVPMSLAKWRERVALSTRELAEKANVAPRTIWRIEGGQGMPHPSTRRKIAEALGCEPKDITEFTESADSPTAT